MEDDPTYDIAIVRSGVSGDAPAADEIIREAVRAALRRHEVRTAKIGVALVDDAHIADLNARHLNHEGPTDVLTFDLRDETDTDAESPAVDVEGDIVMSIETAAAQARQRGHGTDAEAALYAVHGVLHLLGYDDHDEWDAVRMHTVEDEILSSVGIGAVYRTDES